MDIVVANIIDDLDKVEYANEEIKKMLTNGNVLHFDSISELRTFWHRVCDEVKAVSDWTAVNIGIRPCDDKDMLALVISPIWFG